MPKLQNFGTKYPAARHIPKKDNIAFACLYSIVPFFATKPVRLSASNPIPIVVGTPINSVINSLRAAYFLASGFSFLSVILSIGLTVPLPQAIAITV